MRPPAPGVERPPLTEACAEPTEGEVVFNEVGSDRLVSFQRIKNEKGVSKFTWHVVYKTRTLPMFSHFLLHAFAWSLIKMRAPITIRNTTLRTTMAGVMWVSWQLRHVRESELKK